jgi:hypothetical protein
VHHNRAASAAGFANLAGLKNGRLLDAAEAGGFEVLITVDQNIERSGEPRMADDLSN